MNIIQDHCKQMEKMMDDTLMDCPLHMKDIGDHIKSTKGKNIRGKLLLLTSMIKNPDTDTVKLATAIELLHLATLIHDDIIDEAELRRNQASLQSKFGKDQAVMYGDFLFAKCFSLLSKDFTQHLYRLAQGVEKICAGEIFQQSNRYNRQLSVYQYLKAISGKTAALFAMAMLAGAVEGDLDETQQKNASRAGFAIGMCFQIVDDCLDFNGNQKTVGKELEKDLIQGYYTLPLLFALEKDEHGKLAHELEDIRNKNHSPLHAIEWVKAYGGVDKAKKVADRYRERAIKYLGRLPNNAYTKEIKSLVECLCERSA